MNSHSCNSKVRYITTASWWMGSATLVVSFGMVGCQDNKTVVEPTPAPIVTPSVSVAPVIASLSTVGTDGRNFTRFKDNATQRRVALVIGNALYKEEHHRLLNPVNDANDISQDLQKFAFTVITKQDVTHEDMDAAIAEFGHQATNAEVALFYYAGHGIQSKGRNYLIPVDAVLHSEDNLPYRSTDLNQVLEALDNAKSRIKIVMVDACRDNDLIGSKEYRKYGRKYDGPTDLRTRGLAALSTVPEGTIIVYATAPGEIASDNPGGRNGLFTEGLRQALAQGKDLSLGGVLTEASRWVEERSVAMGVKKQMPYVNGPLTLQKDFYFAGSSLVEQERLLREQVAKESEQERLRRKQQELKRARQAFEPEMVDIPAGCFMMGSPESEAGRSNDEGPQHEVCVKAFQAGKYEITVGQFAAFVTATSYKTAAETGNGCYGWTGSEWKQNPEFNWRNVGFTQTDQHPVACVSWPDSIAYTEWLSRVTGKTYRLPSEAEWEYAARAGTTTARYWVNDPNQACRYANVHDQTSKRINTGFAWEHHNCDDGYAVAAPVGQFQPNAFGVYDILGNVWEWNQDKWHHSYASAPTDGSAWEAGDSNSRMLRGGSWYSGPDFCRTADRGNLVVSYNSDGFRVALSARIL